MAKALLLNMKDYTIVKEFDSMDLAQEAQDLAEYSGFPKHLVDREEWDLTAVDMAKFYNNLVPENVRVKRFSDRPAAQARLLRALNGEVLPVTDETAVKETVRKKRTGKLQTTTTEESIVKTKRAKKKAPTAAKKTAAAANGVGRQSKDLDAVVKPLKKGLEKRWQPESERAKLFKFIEKKAETTIGAILKFGENELKMTVGKIRAAIGIMSRDTNIKVSGG